MGIEGYYEDYFDDREIVPYMETNYDKIRKMTLDQMTDFLISIYGGDIWCSDCVDMEYEDCYDEENNRHNCYYFIKPWLESTEDKEGLLNENKNSK